MGPSGREVIESTIAGPVPDSVVMAGIYEQVKTPYKLGVVLKEEGKKVDCPSIFRYGNKWYMTYIIFDGTGYETAMAESQDLIYPSEPWDSTYAHKPWVIKHDGIVYHYYCAVGDQGRVIALATSDKMDQKIGRFTGP